MSFGDNVGRVCVTMSCKTDWSPPDCCQRAWTIIDSCASSETLLPSLLPLLSSPVLSVLLSALGLSVVASAKRQVENRDDGSFKKGGRVTEETAETKGWVPEWYGSGELKASTKTLPPSRAVAARKDHKTRTEGLIVMVGELDGTNG